MRIPNTRINFSYTSQQCLVTPCLQGPVDSWRWFKLQRRTRWSLKTWQLVKYQAPSKYLYWMQEWLKPNTKDQCLLKPSFHREEFKSKLSKYKEWQLSTSIFHKMLPGIKTLTRFVFWITEGMIPFRGLMRSKNRV